MEGPQWLDSECHSPRKRLRLAMCLAENHPSDNNHTAMLEFRHEYKKIIKDKKSHHSLWLNLELAAKNPNPVFFGGVGGILGCRTIEVL